MKLVFFLIAFTFVMIQAYLVTTRHGKHSDDNDGTMTVSADNYYEQIKWSGKITLDDSETRISSITPGGYLKFRENDLNMLAESNMRGEISYQLFDGKDKLNFDEIGNRFVAECLKKMIARGINAEGRAARINRMDGYRGLLAAIPTLQSENLREPYLDLLFENDSLKADELSDAVRLIARRGEDIDKEELLDRLLKAHRVDSVVSAAYIDIVAELHSDGQKSNLLVKIIEKDSLCSPLFNRIMEITTHFNNDMDKRTVYHQLLTRRNTTEDQFVALIGAASDQQADIDKRDLLINLSKEIPRTQKVKEAYLKAAKKIENDADFGAAVKVIE